MAGPSEVRSIWGTFTIIDRITGPLQAIQTAMDGVKQNLTTTAAAFDNLQNYMEKHAEVLGVIGGEIAYISNITKNFMIDSARAASSEMAMMSYLTDQYGAGAQAYVEKLQNLSGGIYSTSQIMAKVNYAKSMGVDYDDMGTIIAGSRALAKMRGGNPEEVMNQLIYGLTAPSGGVRQLARAGVEVSEASALQKYSDAARLHGAVTQEEIKQYALRAAVMDNLNDKIKEAHLESRTLDESTRALSVSWGELGEKLAGYVLPILQKLADIATAILNLVNMIPGPILAVIGVLIFAAAILGIVTGALFVQSFVIKVLIKDHMTLAEALHISAVGYAEFGAAVTASILPTVSETFAVNGLVAGIGALLIEILPVTIAVMALAMAILYVQDALTKPHVEDWAIVKDLKKVQDLLDSLYNNPLGRALLMTNPAGAAYTVGRTEWDLGNAMNSALQPQPTTVTIHIPITANANTKEVEQAVHNGIRTGLNMPDNPMLRVIKSDLKSSGA